MATAAAAGSNTPGASSGATTSSIGSNSVKPLRYARTLQPRTELTTPITTINVYVYKKDEDIRKTIDEFIDHLFAVVNTNKTPPETTVYTQPDFIAFLNLQPVVPISQSSLPIDDVATAVAIAAVIADGNSTTIRVAVGKYTTDYPGYRKVTMANWMNSTFQTALLQAHQQRGGWPLLEDPLLCNYELFVDEGGAQIDGAYVAEVGFNSSQQLRGVYSAMNTSTKVEWNTTAPTLGSNWRVVKSNVRDGPCLFVRNDFADTIVPIIGPAVSPVMLGTPMPYP